MEDSALAEKVAKAVQEYERDSQQRIEELEKRVTVLQAEKEQLRSKLQQHTSAWADIADEGLRERLGKLGSPPLDTLVREAGVALEDRLRRVVGDEEGKRHGVRLVDAVFNPKTGMLIASEHSGEQEGVHLLYRGAMQFIRNPPMHRTIEYRESTARLHIRLIDSLLQLLSELESTLEEDELTVEDVRTMLTRRPVSKGQLDLYRALFMAGDQGLTSSELAAAMNRSRSQVAGVLGALGRRINNTERLEGKGGILVILDVVDRGEGEWHYHMKPVLLEALEAERVVLPSGPQKVTVDGVRRILTRIRIPNGQLDLYQALYSAGDQGLTSSELVAAMKRSGNQVRGVLGALGRRIANTEGFEEEGGIYAIFEISDAGGGEYHYRMRPVLRKALEAESIV